MAKGWTVVILIMILDVDVTAAGGIIKLIARKSNPPPSGPKAPSNLRTLRPPSRSILRTFLYNPLNPHTAGVSNAARLHRHLERRYVPLWEIDRNRSHDALSREISRRNAARTIRGGDFSTPLRFGRNDGGRGPLFCHLGREISPLRSATVEMTEGAGRFFYNLRRQPPPQPSGPKAPSNLRTLRPIGPVNPKNLPL